MWTGIGSPKPQTGCTILDQVGISDTDYCEAHAMDNSALADDVCSMYITRRDHFGHAGRPTVTGKLDTTHLGPQVVLHDMQRGQGWDVATHGGAVTYPHHDASGLGTWGYPESGSKIWGILRVHNDMELNDRGKLFKAFDEVFDEDWQAIQSRVLIGTILIEEGDVL
jgi:hypothetical protein